MATESVGNGQGTGPAERSWARLVAVVTVALVALPGARLALSDDAPDGFPLSTYPMFVHDRGDVVVVPTVVAAAADVGRPVGPGDDVERLSPAAIAGTDQVVQAGVTVRRAIAAAGEGDTGPVAELCEQAAEEVAAPATVIVATEQYDLVAWSAATSSDPAVRTEVHRCPARG